MKMKWLLFVVLVLSLGGAWSAIGEVSTQAAPRVVIDVRSADEFAEGHVDGAVLIPHDEIRDRIGAVVPDKSTPVALYCRSGRRSGLALKTLQELGYTAVENLGGLAEARKKLEAK